MPIIVAQDDVIIRTAQVILDPETDPQRYLAFSDYYRVDLSDFDGWVRSVRKSVPGLYPSRFKMVADENTLIKELKDADGLICESFKVGSKELSAAPNLKVIQNFGTNTRNIDLNACASQNVVVHTLRRRVNIAVAEHALAMMLAMAKKLPLLDGRIDEASLHEAGFPARMHDRRHAAAANWGRVSGLGTMYGATVGCLGLGEIGREVAMRAHAFGAKILYHQRNRVPEEIEKSLGAVYLDFDDLMSQSDYISVHLPSNRSTKGLIDYNAFKKMKDGVFIVNVSRAEIIDRRALIDVLDRDRLGGIALDVHYKEPAHSDDPIKNYAKALLTPHSAVGSRDNAAADMEELIGNIAGAI